MKKYKKKNRLYCGFFYYIFIDILEVYTLAINEFYNSL